MKHPFNIMTIYISKNYFSNVSFCLQLTCKPKGKKVKPEYCCSTFKRGNIGSILGKYIHVESNTLKHTFKQSDLTWMNSLALLRCPRHVKNSIWTAQHKETQTCFGRKHLYFYWCYCSKQTPFNKHSSGPHQTERRE